MVSFEPFIVSFELFLEHRHKYPQSVAGERAGGLSVGKKVKKIKNNHQKHQMHQNHQFHQSTMSSGRNSIAPPAERLKK